MYNTLCITLGQPPAVTDPFVWTYKQKKGGKIKKISNLTAKTFLKTCFEEHSLPAKKAKSTNNDDIQNTEGDEEPDQQGGASEGSENSEAVEESKELKTGGEEEKVLYAPEYVSVIHDPRADHG